MYTFCEREYWESEDFDLSYWESINGRHASLDETKAWAKKYCLDPVIIEIN